MPRVASNDPGNDGGMIRSHRFPGANTALPPAKRDDQQLQAVVDFLRAGQVTVDLFALVRGGELPEGIEVPAAGERRIASTFAIGEESELSVPTRIGAPAAEEIVTAPLNRRGVPLVRGESVRVDAVVRTRKVGHFFPGGTVDAFDVWLELQAVDGRGQILFWSGKVEDNGKGPVEKGAHFYRSLLLDEHGNPINKRNAWAARSVAYVRLIPPGAADTAHFRFTIPDHSDDTIHLKAKLNYRKFSWWNTHWAFAGVRDPEDKRFALAPGYDDGRWLFTGDTSQVSGQRKTIPQLPIVVMAEDAVELKVTDRDSSPQQFSVGLAPADRDRWN